MSRKYHLGCIRDAVNQFCESEKRELDKDFATLEESHLAYAYMTGIGQSTVHYIRRHLDALEAENDTEVLDNE